MTSTTQRRPAREPVKRKSASKILVALDTASECLATLEMAARVATQTEAELVALFIEDSDLIRLAGLPFARELNRSSGTERRLEPPHMARALRAQQQRVNQVLVQIKQRLAVQTSLRVVQGLGAGVLIIEGLDLARVPPGDYELLCLPLLIERGDGAPARGR